MSNVDPGSVLVRVYCRPLTIPRNEEDVTVVTMAIPVPDRILTVGELAYDVKNLLEAQLERKVKLAGDREFPMEWLGTPCPRDQDLGYYLHTDQSVVFTFSVDVMGSQDSVMDIKKKALALLGETGESQLFVSLRVPVTAVPGGGGAVHT